jgi:regulator of extracellular matrix RemA (YlzA/DUF370 family)
MLSADRVVALVNPDSAPIKRFLSDSREGGLLIDATYGRRTRSVIVTDSGHVVLSSVASDTIAGRLIAKGGGTAE